MAIIPRLLFVLVLIVAPIVVYATSAGLPERVATHFGPAGVANGWMHHETYLAFMLAMTTLLPLFVVAMTGFFPRIAVSQIRIAHREHWLAPNRRAETLAWLDEPRELARHRAVAVPRRDARAARAGQRRPARTTGRADVLHAAGGVRRAPVRVGRHDDAPLPPRALTAAFRTPPP